MLDAANEFSTTTTSPSRFGSATGRDRHAVGGKAESLVRTPAAPGRRRRVVAASRLLLLLVLPVALCEWWVSTRLFDHVSYTNSVSLDATLAAWNARDDWRIVFVGDSEVRWGFDPAIIDDEFRAAGLSGPGFNFGIDGFSGSRYRSVLPFLPFDHARDLRVAVIGVQMVETFGFITPEEWREHGIGELHRPVLTSAFASDSGFDVCIDDATWTNATVELVESASATIRYRREIRRLLLESLYAATGGSERLTPGVIDRQSNGLPYHPNGYQPHLPIEDCRPNYDRDVERLLEQRRDLPDHFAPLDPSEWRTNMKRGAYFDMWAEHFLSRGILPVFVALPTNPYLVDLRNRREDYARNSELLHRWAATRNVVFIDLGIQDDLVHDEHYSDYRHLSGLGAEVWSHRLGAALAANERVRSALRDTR